MHRAEIVVDGDVQGVGYRYQVRRAAWKHRLTGTVENLEDGRVKIICEGEKEKIKAFIEDIKIETPPISVENVVYKLLSATGEFRVFKIVTGSPEEEMVEGFSTGAVYLSTLRDELKGFKEENNHSLKEMATKTDQLREDINLNFRALDEKYHAVSDELRSINQNIARLTENISRSNELLAKLVGDYLEPKRKPD